MYIQYTLRILKSKRNVTFLLITILNLILQYDQSEELKMYGILFQFSALLTGLIKNIIEKRKSNNLPITVAAAAALLSFNGDRHEDHRGIIVFDRSDSAGRESVFAKRFLPP